MSRVWAVAAVVQLALLLASEGVCRRLTASELAFELLMLAASLRGRRDAAASAGFRPLAVRRCGGAAVRR